MKSCKEKADHGGYAAVILPQDGRARFRSVQTLYAVSVRLIGSWRDKLGVSSRVQPGHSQGIARRAQHMALKEHLHNQSRMCYAAYALAET